MEIRIPVVRRARGYRLYDHQGRVYLDLHQCGGRALLGHRPPRLTTTLKDVISRGTIADLPSLYLPRLERVLARLVPGFTAARVVRSPERALELAAAFIGRPAAEVEAAEPLRPAGPAGPVRLWRPFAPEPGGGEGAQALLPVLPFVMGGAPAAVLFRSEPPEGFPASEPVSAVVLAGALRALADLPRYRPADWYRDDLLAGCRGWAQKGIYVLPDFPPDGYPGVFEGFLNGGVLLSPGAGVPSVLPAEASTRELKRMLGLFRRYPGG